MCRDPCRATERPQGIPGETDMDVSLQEDKGAIGSRLRSTRRLLMAFICLLALGLPSSAAEAPCGIDREAERINALVKSEVGVYGGVVTPYIKQILESGGIEAASADALFDKLAKQAKQDGYDLRNIVSNLKNFNRLVLSCKEYPDYLKRQKTERERAAKEREQKRQAELARQKQLEDQERLARLENERLEREKEAQRQLELENERKGQEEERLKRIEAEFQAQVDQKAASLSKGVVVRIPSSVGSLTDPAYRGRIGVFDKLIISGDQHTVTIRDLRDLKNTGDDLDWVIRAVKKRKQYDIVLSKRDFIKIEILARTEKQYFGR